MLTINKTLKCIILSKNKQSMLLVFDDDELHEVNMEEYKTIELAYEMFDESCCSEFNNYHYQDLLAAGIDISHALYSEVQRLESKIRHLELSTTSIAQAPILNAIKNMPDELTAEESELYDVWKDSPIAAVELTEDYRASWAKEALTNTTGTCAPRPPVNDNPILNYKSYI